MVHLNTSPKLAFDEPEVFNAPCQHAFVLVGTDPVFAVHMTQYHCEKHKYQLVMQIRLPGPALEEYRRQRELFPDDTFVLCNLHAKKMTIPSLGGGTRKAFDGAIYRGFRPPKTEPPAPDWFPWNDADTLPVAGLGDLNVTIERVVMFRPFCQNDRPPPVANYLLFGGMPKNDDDPRQAHMTNIQTGALLTDPFNVPLYGLDVDHVMSLEAKPQWLADEMLVAGIMVSVPAIPRLDPETGRPVLLLEPPMKNGRPFEVMYRGIQPPRAVVAGPTFLWASLVCNSEPLLDASNTSMVISAMPRIYWK